MRFHNMFLSLVFLSISMNLHAKKFEYLGNCREENRIENFEDCLDKELFESNQELNKIYNDLKSKRIQKNLKKIEIMWINFKEADCDYIAREVHGGLYYQFIYKVCLINKTNARISDLKRSLFYSEWFEKKLD